MEKKRQATRRQSQRVYELCNQHKHLVLGLLALFILLLIFNNYTQRLFVYQRYENALIDFQLEIQGNREPNDIVLLGFFESTFSIPPEDRSAHPALEFAQPGWPWDRAFFAYVVERLSEAGAKVVVVDFVFANPQGEGDWDLADALSEYREKVVLGLFINVEEYSSGEKRVSVIYPYEDLLPLNDEGMLGYVNFPPDFDGVSRRIVHGKSKLGEHLPEDDPKRQDLEIDLYSLSYQAASHVREPDLEEIGEPVYINWAGTANSYPIFPIESIFFENWKTVFKDGEYFQDKVVIIGPYYEPLFKDWHRTPLGSMPGMEVHANLIWNLINDSYLQKVSNWMEALSGAIVLLFAAFALFLLKGSLSKFAAAAGTGVVFIVFSQYLFEAHITILPFFGPLLALGLYATSDIIINFGIEQYERNRIRSVLDRHVSSNVAEIALADRSSFEERLKGKKQFITILFSDIRGFTTMTEKAMENPEVFVGQLNEYFWDMVDIVQHEHDGTLQKFIGDAIMAAWGDTIPSDPEKEATAAVKCALRMVEALDALNARWVARPEFEQLKIGIGINSGEAIVGNIGHPERMEFTALGDVVNLAARLESATKQFSQAILVGSSVYELSKKEIPYRYVGKLQVKGKSFGIDVYAPLAMLPKKEPEWLIVHHRAMKHFQQRDFDKAHSLFEKVIELRQEDQLAQKYIPFCQKFQTDPPTAGWDGTIILDEK